MKIFTIILSLIALFLAVVDDKTLHVSHDVHTFIVAALWGMFALSGALSIAQIMQEEK